MAGHLECGVSEETSIQVNFGRAMALFPLDQVVLLPQQVLPLHIFEPRYRQMIQHALDASGQFAMAVFEGPRWKGEYHGRPPVRPAVCVGQILQHEKLEDGRYNVLVQGVCRAKILHEQPAEEGRLYRMAFLEPVGIDDVSEAADLDLLEGERTISAHGTTPGLEAARVRLRELLSDGPLSRLAAAPYVLNYLNKDEFHTSALLEVVSFTLIGDAALRYRLLAEGAADTRARLILGELEHLSGLIRRAVAQKPEDWPKGCSWN